MKSALVHITYSNGDVYEGEAEDTTRSGWGRYFYVSTVYRAQRDLKSIVSGPNTTPLFIPTYEGQWKAGHKHGYGTFRESEDQCLAGTWVNDKLHGFCTTIGESNERFVGYFQRGRRYGFGRVSSPKRTLLSVFEGNRAKGAALAFDHRSGKVYAEQHTAVRRITSEGLVCLQGKRTSRVPLDTLLPMTPLPSEASEGFVTSAREGAPAVHRSVNSRVRRLSGRLTRRGSTPVFTDHRRPRSARIKSACAAVASRGIATWTTAHVKVLMETLGIAELMGPVVESHQLDGEAILALLRLCGAERERIETFDEREGVKVVCEELEVEEPLGWYFLTGCQELVKLEYRRKERIREIVPPGSQEGPPEDPTYDVFAAVAGGIPELRRYLFDGEDLKLEQHLGQGGFGRVDLFRSASMHILVAGKELKRDFMSLRTPSFSYQQVRALKEFANELSLLAALRHPNITMLWGVCLKRPRPLLLTEYIPDGSLLDLLHRRREKLSRSGILSISKHVCAAMEYLHNENILHCDLKSSNVLLKISYGKDEQPRYLAKICDFGLAKSFLLAPALGGQCGIVENLLSMQDAAYEVGHEVGTPHWMAPEVCRGNAHTRSSDTYAFGLLLWEMLTNEIPLVHMKAHIIGAAVGFGRLRVKTPRVSTRVSADLINIFRRCTDPDPRKRPTFAELHRDFQTMAEIEESTRPSHRRSVSLNLLKFLKRSETSSPRPTEDGVSTAVSRD